MKDKGIAIIGSGHDPIHTLLLSSDRPSMRTLIRDLLNETRRPSQWHPSDDLREEYELILQKKSSLSRRERDRIVALFEKKS